MKYLRFLITVLLSITAAAASSSLSHSNTERDGLIASKHIDIATALNSRQLRIGDFDEFNELFKDASIELPGPFSTEDRVAFIPLNVNIYNVRCYGVNIGDMSISHKLKSQQDIEVSINVLQLDLDCEMNYDYKWGAARGDGRLKVQTDDSSASTSINFFSDDFNTKPPKSSAVSGSNRTFASPAWTLKRISCRKFWKPSSSWSGERFPMLSAMLPVTNLDRWERRLWRMF